MSSAGLLSTRNVYLFLGAAGISLLATFGVVVSDRGRASADTELTPVFPEIEDSLYAQAWRKIAISAGGETFHVAFTPETGWSIPEKGGYPADIEDLRALGFDLTRLSYEAPKTNNVDWHEALELVAPGDGGDAARITVSGEGDAVIADLLVGKRASAARLAAGGLDPRTYIRLPGDNQTWLAKGEISAGRSAEDWLSLDVLNVARDDIKSVRGVQSDGRTFELSRENAEAEVFTLVEGPEGATLDSDTAPNRLAFALSNANFDDVIPADQLDPEAGERYVYTLFDETVLTVRALEAASAEWLIVRAEAGPRAETLNAALAGWGFAAPSYLFDRFQSPLDEMLAAPEEEAALDALDLDAQDATVNNE